MVAVTSRYQTSLTFRLVQAIALEGKKTEKDNDPPVDFNDTPLEHKKKHEDWILCQQK